MELYNLENDPTELTDLASEKPDILNELVARYDEWADETGVIRYPVK